MSRFFLYEQRAQALICHNPGKFTMTTSVPKDIPNGGSPLPIPDGTLLRFGRMLGCVEKERVYTPPGSEKLSYPLYRTSVMIKCIASIDRFKELDLETVHVWSLPLCQVVDGNLEQHARKDPTKFLELFCKVEQETPVEPKPRKVRKFPVRKRDNV